MCVFVCGVFHGIDEQHADDDLWFFFLVGTVANTRTMETSVLGETSFLGWCLCVC